MENRKGNEIFLGVIGVATLVVAIIGATFAFFTATANNNTTITGTTAQGNDLALVVNKLAPTGDYAAGKLVPLQGEISSTESELTTVPTLQMQSALTAQCVDTSHNAVCHVYSIQITNNGDTAVNVGGTLTLTGSPAMKWKVITDATTDDANATINSVGSAGNIVTSENLTTANDGKSHTYYVVVWLEETSTTQNETDANTPFSGDVVFNAVDGSGNTTGLTATFS